MSAVPLVPAAARTLDLFEAFRAARRPLSLSELARATGVPVSTCHGLVRTLEHRGYLYFPTAREAYPTRRLLELAQDIDAHDPLLGRLLPALQALRDATGETVIVGLRQADAVLYLLVLDSPQIVRYTARAGELKPLHASAIGKVLLGAMADADLAEWLVQHPLPRVTPGTLTSARRLRKDLDDGRARGYQATRGENVADVMAVAAPLRQGGNVLGVAVAGPLHRMDTAEAKHAARLLQAVRTLEERTGG